MLQEKSVSPGLGPETWVQVQICHFTIPILLFLLVECGGWTHHSSTFCESRVLFLLNTGQLTQRQQGSDCKLSKIETTPTMASSLQHCTYHCPCSRNSNWGVPGCLSGWASAFGSGHDPGVLGSGPTSGSPWGACFCLSLCLSWINK